LEITDEFTPQKKLPPELMSANYLLPPYEGTAYIQWDDLQGSATWSGTFNQIGEDCSVTVKDTPGEVVPGIFNEEDFQAIMTTDLRGICVPLSFVKQDPDDCVVPEEVKRHTPRPFPADAVPELFKIVGVRQISFVNADTIRVDVVFMFAWPGNPR
jgi:hypothetical protein